MLLTNIRFKRIWYSVGRAESYTERVMTTSSIAVNDYVATINCGYQLTAQASIPSEAKGCIDVRGVLPVYEGYSGGTNPTSNGWMNTTDSRLFAFNPLGINRGWTGVDDYITKFSLYPIIAGTSVKIWGSVV